MGSIGPRRLTSPTTDYYAYADVVGQNVDANYSVIRLRVTCINRGNSSSFSNGSGSHTSAVDDFGIAYSHSAGSNFLPSGVPTNGTRWDEYGDYAVGHDGAGNLGDRTFRQAVSASNGSATDYGTINIPRIPHPPQTATSSGSVDQLAPTSLRYNFAWGGDDGGAGVSGYDVQVATDAAFGAVVKTVSASGSPITITGLGGGITYYVRSRAVNSRGAGPWGADASGTTLAGVYAVVGGAWTPCAVYAGINGVWTPCEVKAGRAGAWVGLTT